jgi:hypothetical protein
LAIIRRFLTEGRIAVHHVDPRIHVLACPIWFFSQRRWLAQIDDLGFDVLMRWQVLEDVIQHAGKSVLFEGLLVGRVASHNSESTVAISKAAP